MTNKDQEEHTNHERRPQRDLERPWGHAPRANQNHEGRQASMEGDAVAILYGLWVDAAGLILSASVG